MIVVAFYGSLEGKLNAHPNVKTEIQSLLRDMANHYLQTKINSKPRFYDRFKIQRNDRFWTKKVEAEKKINAKGCIFPRWHWFLTSKPDREGAGKYNFGNAGEIEQCLWSRSKSEVMQKDKQNDKQTEVGIGKNLMLVRLKHGLNQQEAADKLGLTLSSIKAIERNNYKPNYIILRKYKKVFKTTYDFLIDGVYSP